LLTALTFLHFNIPFGKLRASYIRNSVVQNSKKMHVNWQQAVNRRQSASSGRDASPERGGNPGLGFQIRYLKKKAPPN
jgi:hypothetical protein